MTFCIRRLYFCSVQCGVLCKHSRFCYHSHGETSQIQHQRWFVQRWFFYEVSRILKDHNLMHILYKCCFFLRDAIRHVSYTIKSAAQNITRSLCFFYYKYMWLNFYIVIKFFILYEFKKDFKNKKRRFRKHLMITE